MKQSSPQCLKGKWRIVEMPTWPADHLDLVGPAYIEFDGSGHGEFTYDNGDESTLRARGGDFFNSLLEHFHD